MRRSNVRQSKLSAGMRWGWLLWWGVWAAFALPWGGLEGTPQWRRIEWLPFALVRPRDWLLNLLFFVPFGYLVARAGWRLRSVLATSGIVSVLVETLQTFSRHRFPSTTDVVTNVAGAALGVLVAACLLPRERP